MQFLFREQMQHQPVIVKVKQEGQEKIKQIKINRLCIHQNQMVEICRTFNILQHLKSYVLLKMEIAF